MLQLNLLTGKNQLFQTDVRGKNCVLLILMEAWIRRSRNPLLETIKYQAVIATPILRLRCQIKFSFRESDENAAYIHDSFQYNR